MFNKGIFGGLFDFDGDGELNFVERAMDFSLFMKLANNNGKNECEDEHDCETELDCEDDSKDIFDDLF